MSEGHDDHRDADGDGHGNDEKDGSGSSDATVGVSEQCQSYPP